MSANEELVSLGDVDELVRQADRLAEAAAWDELVDLRDRCRDSLDRGLQLWPAASRCEYRLALDAPGPWAARVLVAGTGRFALGPLPEVAASTKRWEDLAPHVVQGAPEAAIAAHERVVRGEDLHGDRRLDPFVLEVPLQLAAWEPSYPVATYGADEASFPLPIVGGHAAVSTGPRARTADDPETVRGLVELASAWTRESDGTATAIAVHGDAAAAVGALGFDDVRMAAIAPQQAVAMMAWTAASGGAHGRRRGMAAGRFAAWWAASAVTGLLEEFPPDPSELGDALAELQWWAWDADGPDLGWTCRLAVEDPADGLAWALDATDGVPHPI
ncbi:MAG TPA: hypothetical protein VM143_08285 [Acidimicrobiales bacterium]|nr:hypothetical protein [Acidimicrobiales bacterium]